MIIPPTRVPAGKRSGNRGEEKSITSRTPPIFRAAAHAAAPAGDTVHPSARKTSREQVIRASSVTFLATTHVQPRTPEMPRDNSATSASRPAAATTVTAGCSTAHALNTLVNSAEDAAHAIAKKTPGAPRLSNTEIRSKSVISSEV